MGSPDIEDFETALDDVLYEWNAYNEKISSAVREGQKNPTNQNPQKYEDARKALLEMIPRCEKWGAQALAFWEMFANNERLTAELSRLRTENERLINDNAILDGQFKTYSDQHRAAMERLRGRAGTDEDTIALLRAKNAALRENTLTPDAIQDIYDAGQVNIQEVESVLRRIAGGESK